MTAEALYHRALVQLARAAIGAGSLEAPDGSATLDNPVCGDEVTVELRIRQGVIAAMAHRVRGCVLCEAAASLLGRAAPGETPSQVAAVRAGLAAMLQGGAPPPGGPWAALAVFAPVGSVRSRHACALLPFDALAEAARRGRA